MQSYKQAIDVCYQLQVVAAQLEEGNMGVFDEYNTLSDCVSNGISSHCPDTALIWSAAVKKVAKDC